MREIKTLQELMDYTCRKNTHVKHKKDNIVVCRNSDLLQLNFK